MSGRLRLGRLHRPLLVVGAVVGFAWGFASLHAHRQDARQRFEEHVADVCVAAALRAPRPPTGP